ncbi:YchJ family protein [Micrococcus sp.]|uniref:YchJ family protein n=1 Tax=Micrococcus sp. TaxID=1271 RepID=UPI002A90BEE3|nr:YchJ family metal-binding protein [Micrococcus sp.]MDY6055872.1 YchJ family metal-binding protein [Micrococcus sp.]
MTGTPTQNRACPCGLGLPADQCCTRLHAAFAADGTLAAPTAEALMRSRFAAFARLGEADPAHDDGARTVRAAVAYLRATWAPETRPSAQELTPSAADPAPRFTRLAVTDTTGGPFDSTATVTFVALGRRTGPGGEDAGRLRLAEHSRFRREGGAWLYVDGDVTGG